MEHEKTFDNLISKIAQLLCVRGQRDPVVIGKLLIDLNALSYRVPLFTEPKKVLFFINQCCTSIQPDDDELAPKYAQFIFRLFTTKQNIRIEGRTLTLAIQWCLQALKSPSNSIKVVKALKALEALLRDNVHNVPVLVLEEVWREAEALCKTTNDLKYSDDILYTSVSCLEASTAVKDLNYNRSRFEQCSKLFVSLLQSQTPANKAVMSARVLEKCLKGLHNIVSVDPDFLTRELGLILGFIKTYMVHGLDGIDFLKPERLAPTPLSLPETVLNRWDRPRITVRPKRHRNKKNQNSAQREVEPRNESFNLASDTYIPATMSLDSSSMNPTNCQYKTSDSEVSDSESSKLSFRLCKVRQAALNFLADVVKRSGKAPIFTYWTQFIPESSASGTHNLTACFLRGASYRTVMCALNALLLMLLHAKNYLHQAKFSGKVNSSFTPFSVVLGLTLIELHKSLCFALNQNQMTALTQVLKCLAALVQATPYHQMPKGLVTKVVRNVKPLTYHKDPSVQVTALVVMGCILVLEPPSSEIEQALSKLHNVEGLSVKAAKLTKSPSSDSFDFAHVSSSEDEEEVEVEVDSVPWLLSRSLSNLGVFGKDVATPSKKIVTPVKLESLQILSAMSRNYLNTMMLPYLGHVIVALNNAFADPSDEVILYAGRTTNFLGNAMLINGKPENSAAYLGFWLTLLNGPLVKLVQHESLAPVRTVGCDCLSNIGSRLFQELPRDKRILCVTLLLACAKDDDSNVRGSAVRALSLYVAYPTLRADSGFVMDTAEAVLASLDEQNHNARIKVSWALGTLTNALVHTHVDCPLEPLPAELYLKFFQAGFKGVKDTEKIRTNSVRTLGNVLQLLDEEMLHEDRFKSAVIEALNSIEAACTSAKIAKVKWNACYALSKALKNSSLFFEGVIAWQQSGLPKLADLATNFNNIKVRTGAVQALTAPVKREFYGELFGLVWTALLQSLESSQVIDDPEYNRREQLQEQICLAIGHLTALLTRDDLSQVELHLPRYVELLKTHMRKVIERLVPEKSTELFAAARHLDDLRGVCRGSDERQAVDFLRAVFVTQ